jgi:RecA/RadA recombinase
VRTYDPVTNEIVARPVTNWFNNGPADRFLQFTVEKSSGNGRSQFAATENHLVRTPGGWREAGEIIAGDRVMVGETARLSAQQWQVVLGGLMGDGHLAPNRHGRHGVRFRMGHGAKQAEYVDWKAGLLGNIGQSRSVRPNGSVHVDLTPLPELGELREVVYCLMVPDTHSFVADGRSVARHNRGSARCGPTEAEGRSSIAAFIDAEHALDPRLRQGTSGSTRTRMLVAQPDDGGPRARDRATCSSAPARSTSSSIDSKLLPALVPRAEIEAEMGDSHVGLQARLMSQGAANDHRCPQHHSSTTAIFINQLRREDRSDGARRPRPRPAARR